MKTHTFFLTVLGESLRPLMSEEEGAITTGTYTIKTGTEEFDVLDLEPGEYATGPLGTYAEYADKNGNYYYGIITEEGTMTVSGGPDNYTITLDLTTAQGRSVKCTYTGELTVRGIPQAFSCLEEDYTLDLEGATAYVSNFSDYYGTGGNNWTINLSPARYKTDCLMIDFVTEITDPSEGIPSGTYTASPDDTPDPGQYLQGYVAGSYYAAGTLYVLHDEAGNTLGFAPAISGDLNIENHGDGTYTISFSFLDDKGHTWDGEWTGPLNIPGYAPASAPKSYTINR